MKNVNPDADRRKQLKKAAESYFTALEKKSFTDIPYTEEVVLRAPIAPGGVHQPLSGKQDVFEQWWKPLEPALEGVSITLIDHFYNEDLTSIATRADVTLKGLKFTLRVLDRFVVDKEGKITEQENHFDASPIHG
jgi:hypothetical protein